MHTKYGIIPALSSFFVGNYGAKQICKGNLLKGSTAQLISMVMLAESWAEDWRIAVLAPSMGAAAAGWDDLAQWKFKSGLKKIGLGCAIGLGTKCILKFMFNSSITLRTIGEISGFVAGTGLAQCIFEKTSPYLFKGFMSLTQ